jgi:hypothetical protein
MSHLTVHVRFIGCCGETAESGNHGSGEQSTPSLPENTSDPNQRLRKTTIAENSVSHVSPSLPRDKLIKQYPYSNYNESKSTAQQRSSTSGHLPREGPQPLRIHLPPHNISIHTRIILRAARARPRRNRIRPNTLLRDHNSILPNPILLSLFRTRQNSIQALVSSFRAVFFCDRDDAIAVGSATLDDRA